MAPPPAPPDPPESDPDAGVTVYDVIGEDGFARLTRAFYEQVRADDLLAPMYPDDDWDGAEQRLRDFLVFRFGGPSRYIEARGHPRLRMRHMPFPIDRAARDRWMLLMTKAMREAHLPKEVAVVLGRFFDGTATFMMNREG
ncbi:MAG: globin [Planctomycetota bacterium]